MSRYEDAGVSRAAADEWVSELKSRLDQQRRPEVLSRIGDFSALFEAPKNYKDPIFAATTDGVGTKLLLAEEMGNAAFVGVGKDLVAMSTNDLLASRAESLVFLDYLATGRLEPQRDALLLDGILKACEEAGCSLVGGETAEMPGMYPAGRVDVAGFAIGVLERGETFTKSARPGDRVLGFSSSGFHSNGFSLIRKIMRDRNLSVRSPWGDVSLGEVLLEPTRVYGNSLLKLLRREGVRGAVHITGGGLVENIPRVIAEEDLKVHLDSSNWEIPRIMRDFVEWGSVEWREAFSTWNMGVGFCVLVSPEEKLEDWEKEGAFLMGELQAFSGKSGVEIR